jgi:competence protein ComEC
VGDAIALFHVQNKQKDNEDSSFSRYRWRNGLAALFFQPSLQSRLIARPAAHWAFSSWWHTQRTHLYTTLKDLLGDSLFPYCSALFLGNRDSPSLQHTQQLFARWGLTHYLARSGLHIALIIALWSSFLLWLPLPIQGKLLLLLLLLYLYSMLSWTSVSYQRALWLFVLLCGAAFLRRRPQTVYLLSLLATATLLHTPAHLFFLDFQLTFFLTAFLLVLTTLLRRIKQIR